MTITTTPTTCPDWCELPHSTDDPHHEDTHHERVVLAGQAVNAWVAAMPGYGPFIEVEHARKEPLNARELRAIIDGLTAALTILEQHNANMDPLDEDDKRDRIDGGGAIWEWNETTTCWEHVGREMPPQDSLQTLDGPLRFEN